MESRAAVRALLTCTLILFTCWNNAQAQEEEGHCVMYGQCGEGDYGSLNCVYNGPPKPIQDENSLNILRQICPEFVQDGKALTCCDPLQLEAMESNFKLPARLLNRCPSCFANFRKNFCRLTCSPIQSRYLAVTETQKNDEGKQMINQITYYMADRFAFGLFESCQNVEGFIPGTRVIEMMCGGWSSKCTGPKWLQFMGSTPENQGFSPFQINYTIVTESEIKEGNRTFYPMDDPVFKCSEAPTPNDKACSCGDCKSSCSIPSTEATTTEVRTETTVQTTTSTTIKITDASSSIPGGTTATTTTTTTTTAPATTTTTKKPDNASSGASTIGTKINNKLFRRILSPLIVIAPAFGDE